MADTNEQTNSNVDAEKKPEANADASKTDAGKSDKAADQGDDKAKAEAEAARVAAERAAEIEAAAEKKAKKLAEKLIKEATEKAQREAAEAAELAKKSDLERAQAAAKKAEEKLAELERTAAEAKLEASLATALIDADLKPASPKARAHILNAFRSHVADGKDADDAIKAVLKDEAYLFAAKVSQAKEPEKKAANTGGKAGGKDDRGAGNVTENGGTKAPIKNPGDLENPTEIASSMRLKHGISVPLN